MPASRIESEVLFYYRMENKECRSTVVAADSIDLRESINEFMRIFFTSDRPPPAYCCC